ncbi:cyclin-dependent kinase inhibitor 3-like isoform X2 [Penaeus chinensis]|uniref:cyclin-dependent kinase inhibitor 3-like isoform X2 n=1 Tax=Penaeus chinensis TaxID=139456 RepID=UPI001FB6DD59|nr:cyclin-dependent kinase inhibitor 3-like isoform X2 [Penaeus chinensis]
MFDSSDSEEETNVVPVQTLKIDWLDMSFMGCPESVALSGLPGCCFRNIFQNLSTDLDNIEERRITDIVTLVTKGELRKYRVPDLISEYEIRGIRVYHYPFLDGTAPSIDIVMAIIDCIRQVLEEKRKVLVHNIISFKIFEAFVRSGWTRTSTGLCLADSLEAKAWHQEIWGRRKVVMMFHTMLQEG